MERVKNPNEGLPYVKPEAQLLALCTQENIATSQPAKAKIFLDEFDGEGDMFD